jgi:hypothetical protein
MIARCAKTSPGAYSGLSAFQVVIADIAFLTYGFWNGWEIPGSTISAWLGAVVVQVIAVGLVIARSLFPQPPPMR